MKRELIHQLQAILGQDGLLLDPVDLAAYSSDNSKISVLPALVALPTTAEQVSAVMTLANKYRVPVVPRGAASGTTGGAVPCPDSLVLSCSRMNRIVEIDDHNMIAVVEPGVITADLVAALAPHGLLYPPDPASLKYCTIGGNAGECAGGPSAVKYGVTKDWILGLEVVLPDGSLMRTGVRTEKGVVGYDLTHLFIGSEGTLGIFTKLILRLIPRPVAQACFLLTFQRMQEATALVAELLHAGFTPCTLEFMDQAAIQVVNRFMSTPLSSECEALLLVELDGNEVEVERDSQRLTKVLIERQIRYQKAGSEQERTALWQARRSISPACFDLKPHKINEDIVVPRSRIPDLVQQTRQLAEELDLTILTFGHAGDGNIHTNIMLDKNDEGEFQRARIAKQRLFDFVLSIDGTLSGEHGVGLTKAAYIGQEVDPVALAMMRRIKELFDPHNLLNPGKIFPVDPSSASN